MSDLEFRSATEDDWPQIYPIFAAVTSSGDTYPYPPGMSSDDAKTIWMAPGHSVFVATEGSTILGAAYVRANSPGLGDHVCNAGWMVDPARQGEGIGRRFAGYVIDESRGLGFRGMQFNAVVATNEPAIALWESLGFRIVGTIPDAFRHQAKGLTAVHVMYREL